MVEMTCNPSGTLAAATVACPNHGRSQMSPDPDITGITCPAALRLCPQHREEGNHVTESSKSWELVTLVVHTRLTCSYAVPMLG